MEKLNDENKYTLDDFEIGEDIAFRFFNEKDKKWKLYIGTLTEKDGNVITINNFECNRENVDGALTIDITTCKYMNKVAIL